jgi:hypothetical protein
MRKMTETLNIVVAMLAAFNMLGLYFHHPLFANYHGRLFSGTIGGFMVVVAALVLLLNLLTAIQEYRRGGFRRNLLITTESGQSVFSIRALEAQILDDLGRAPDVTDAAVQMEVQGEGQPVLCHLAFKLRRQEDVAARVDQIKQSTRESFTRLLPTGVGIEIDANVTDLVSERAVSAGASGEGGEFSGPVYPVCDSEEDRDFQS